MTPSKRMLLVDCIAPHPTWPICQSTDDEIDKRLFQLIRSLKDGKDWYWQGKTASQVDFLTLHVNTQMFSLATGRLLVPVPRSAARTDSQWGPANEWPSRAIAEGLASAMSLHVGHHLWRSLSVKQSSKSTSDERTTINEHVASLLLVGQLPTSTPITLVDDSLTRGTQLAACAHVLRVAGYQDVRAVCGAHVLGSSLEARTWNVQRKVEWHDGDSQAHAGPATAYPGTPVQL